MDLSSLPYEAYDSGTFSAPSSSSTTFSIYDSYEATPELTRLTRTTTSETTKSEEKEPIPSTTLSLDRSRSNGASENESLYLYRKYEEMMMCSGEMTSSMDEWDEGIVSRTLEKQKRETASASERLDSERRRAQLAKRYEKEMKRKWNEEFQTM